MKRVKSIFFIFLFFVSACGMNAPSFDPLEEKYFNENETGETAKEEGADEDQDRKGGGVESENGGQNGDSDQDLEIGVQELARPGYLYINEIFYDAPGSDTNGDIFIELRGEPGRELDNYLINLVNGDDGVTYKTISIETGMDVGEDGLFVIADMTSNGSTNVEEADILVNFDPQNGPDTIQLLDHESNLLDAIGYGNVPTAVAENGLIMFEGSPALDPPSGYSLSRLEGMEDTDDNSSDFVENSSPSPGTFKVNSTPG